jgi:hypothetical protein
MDGVLRKEHLAYYLDVLNRLNRPSLSEAEKKDFVAIVTLFYEVLPDRERIPREVVDTAFRLRTILKPRLRACGFEFSNYDSDYGEVSKNLYKDVDENVSTVLKLSYAYQR